MMSKEPIRVLHIVGRMDHGGIETMIMNLYRNIDREKVQFDFLSHYGREAAFNDEIRKLGGRIYEMPALRDETHIYYWRYFDYINALHSFFKKHKEYKVIHCHMTNTASIYMPIAKKYGITCCISHSHNTKAKAGMLGVVTDYLQKSIYKHATDMFACSESAMNWFYPKDVVESGKVKVIANAVDAQSFRFNPEKRAEMRKKLDVEDKLVIACIARFRPEKNQTFLIDVLAEILKTRDDVVFVFAGDGPCEEEVKAKAKALNVDKYTRFLGMRSDVPDILQAADVFTLTSLWEGLPVTGIEAQASGLNCVVADGVTREMNACNMVEYLSLDAPVSKWAESFIEAAKKPREDTYEKLKATGYDIHTTAPWLQKFYLTKHEEGINKNKEEKTV